MFYLKKETGDILIYGDEIFTRCIDCNKEMPFDEAELVKIIDDNFDFAGTHVICEECTKKRRTLLRERLEEFLEKLNPIEERVLGLRFGLNDGITRTPGEVGQELGMTGERAGDIEVEALRKLYRNNTGSSN